MTYVISDIHGRGDRFRNILEQIRFSEEDTLYILGDVIDRNPDGIEILLEVMATPNMHMILGNHEYMMLNVVRVPRIRRWGKWADDRAIWYYNGGRVTHRAFENLAPAEQRRVIEYLEGLPLNREVEVGGERYLLIHGSPESTYAPGEPEYPDATAWAVWKRFDPFAENEFTDRTVIYGHTPTYFFTNMIPMEILRVGNSICIDCGCAFPDGCLACLCLETGAVLYSSDAPDRA